VTAPSPSGEQIELSYGEQRAVVVEVGGALRTYSVGGREILDGYALSELCSGGRGHPLMPWPNRVRDGRYEWDGADLQLDINEPALANAIHGLVQWRNWSWGEREPSRVVMAHSLHPTPGYPFALELAISYELLDRGLVVTTHATNAAARACPYGVGFHPYLRLAGASLINDGILTLPAATHLVADERLIPQSREMVAGGAFDFRAPRVLGDLVVDDCFTDLERDSDGLARVAFERPDGSASTVLWLDSAYPYLMVFTGETLPLADRRRGIAIEPMSCAPNALQSGEGLVRLEPGVTHVARWGIEFA